MRRARRKNLAVPLLAVALLAGGARETHAGAFMFAQEGDEDRVTHPTGYDGTGGSISVSVCVLDTSPHASEMLIPVANAVRTWNHLIATHGNLKFSGDNTVPSSDFDFQSAVMHEMGHCIGLGHPNLGTLVSTENSNYTNSTDGDNDSWDLDPGSDEVIGTSDDSRGDDGNLHWFRKSNNDPFSIDATVDSTTYSRDLAHLPTGHDFAANADRDVGSLLGHGDSEAVMQQGMTNDETQRRLNHDDVATLMYAMSGLDETQGTSDDYTLRLEFTGLQSSCDLVVAFDDTETTFATCWASAGFLNSTHLAISSASIYYSTEHNWHFSERPNCDGTLARDFGDDTRSDILIRHATTGRSYLYEMDGRSIRSCGKVPEVTSNTAWEIVGTGDYNGDGRSDILIRKNTTGRTHLYLMEGRFILEEGRIPGITTNLDWVVVGSADFNGDGRADILMRNSVTGSTYMYMLDGRSIVDQGRVNGVFTSPDWQVVAVADLDADGNADMLLRNAVNGKSYVLLLQGRSVVGQGLLEGVTTNPDWQVIGLGHFDRDCKADLALRNQVNGKTYLYFLDGTSVVGQGRISDVSVNLAWTSITIGDYDGDGRADLLLRKTPGGNSYMYLLDGTTVLEQGKLSGVTTNLDWDIVAP